ncbi:predicted protein, partial [Nematostella vectensis]
MHLEEDENDGLFHCPVPDCHNDGFGTQRGCRKHVKKKHLWFYYFDEKPSDSDIEASRSQMEKEKGQRRSSNGVPSFDMSCTFAEQFTAWLKGSGGGCKSDRQAQQLSEWQLGHAGRIGYLDAIAELVTYRKVNGASEAVLRGLSTTDTYLKKKMFKTAGKYGFDSLLLTDTNMSVLEGYITYIRPLLKPKCEYVLVTRNGGQHNKLGELMSKLVFEATGKYVHPTRYRQIVETSSSKLLKSADRSAIS